MRKINLVLAVAVVAGGLVLGTGASPRHCGASGGVCAGAITAEVLTQLPAPYPAAVVSAPAAAAPHPSSTVDSTTPAYLRQVPVVGFSAGESYRPHFLGHDAVLEGTLRR